MEKLNIALLAGGWSGEREVSLNSGEAVFEALDREKYNIFRYDPRDDLTRLIEDRETIDLALVLLHGKLGEDGCLQGFLKLLGIPCLGSGVLPSAMAMNKKIAKKMYRSQGLDVVEDVILFRGDNFSVASIIALLGPSTVVKPVAEGSSLGVTLCHSENELLAGIERAFQYDQEVIVERYVNGREVTCCVLGNREVEALPLIEILPSEGYDFFDYEAKYKPGATKEICPAPLKAALAERVRSCAKKAHCVLECKAWSRTDMIIEGDKIYVLETNTIPGMTRTSLVPLAARTAGMSLSLLLDRLIALSFDLADSG
jgi:D-alanine-D-alanine ligase